MMARLSPLANICRGPLWTRAYPAGAHQSTAKDATRSPMDSDDSEADAAQCLQQPPELCPEPTGDEDGLAT